MADGYNGWSNYETWCAALWMDNDQGSSRYWDESAEQALQREFDLDQEAEAQDIRDNAVVSLAEQMKDEHEESIPELSGMHGDMLRAAMDAINWHEIAAHKISDLDMPAREE